MLNSPPKINRLTHSPLTALSPIDGRYAEKTAELRRYFSEYALLYFRVLIEIRWLEALANCPEIKELPGLSTSGQQFLNALLENFSESDAQYIKSIEKRINHDVKSVEYFLKEKLTSHPELATYSEFIHFACTSEDINNLAYGLMLKMARAQALLPCIEKLVTTFSDLAKHYADLPLLARTHGQPATPTTLGKELAIIAARLMRQKNGFKQIDILGKCNGAVGNFNAHLIAYPTVNWPALSQQFVENLDLAFNPYTTQIEPHDYIAEYCDALARLNTVLIDAARDIWSYISIGYFKLKPNPTEVGSSTMPHKVNPIDFENAEGNLALANSLLHHFSSYLPKSRWQRDLCDSTLLRNLGVGLSHSFLAYQSLIQGLNKLVPDQDKLITDLDQHWEVLAEAIQTVLRRYRCEMPYEQLKNLTRGKQVTKQQLHDFITSLSIPDEAKKVLLELTPSTYLGKAVDLAKQLSSF